jgi:hypothetical protein
MMGSIIQLAQRRAIRKAAEMRRRVKRVDEQRFRYPGPDVVSEVSCGAPRREEGRLKPATPFHRGRQEPAPVPVSDGGDFCFAR